MTYSNEAETRVRRHQGEGSEDRNSRPNYGVRALGVVAAIVGLWILVALTTRPVDNLPPQADPNVAEQTPSVPVPGTP
jgi:hypothetical protein